MTPREEQHGHRRPDRPAVPLAAGHPAEEPGQRRRDREDREHGPEVGPRRRVLEWMRGVGVEEAAAVGAELLDRLLARHRAHRDGLLRALERGDLEVGSEVLDGALLHQDQRDHQARAAAARTACRAPGRPRSSPAAPADRRAMPRTSATASAMPDRRRDEVMERELAHLGEVRHRRLARVRLPVRVGGEGRGGLERLPVGHGRQPCGLSGSRCWSRSTAYVSTMDAR